MNFEKISLKKEIILEPKTKTFIAIFSSKRTSSVGISDESKTKETDTVTTEFFDVYPGHTVNGKNLTEKDFFSKLLKNSSRWNFPCGRIHFQTVCVF